MRPLTMRSHAPISPAGRGVAVSALGAAAVIALAAFLYLRSPIDVLPDRMGPLGILDDLVVLGLAVWWIRRRLADARAAAGRARDGASGRPGNAGRAWERTERAGASGGGARAGGNDTAADAGAGSAWDPWAVLEVPRGAPPDEVTRAYRAQMKRYHPDRVADLGPELRELAHRKVIEIQRAYEEIGPR